MPTPCTDDDGGNIVASQAVCLSGWDAMALPAPRPKVKRASAPNLRAYKTVYGICQSVVGGIPQILVSGEVANQSITGLATAAGGGPPTGTLVVTDYFQPDNHPELQCKLRHIYQPQNDNLGTTPPTYDAVPEQYVVGTSDENTCAIC